MSLPTEAEAEKEAGYRESAAAKKPHGDPEVEWFQNVYRGDVPQFTLRSFVVGSVLGALMALSNLYVGLKTGWGLGVAITACIISFALYSAIARVRVPMGLFGVIAVLLRSLNRVTLGLRFFDKTPDDPNLTILENNAMQSTASSAGYSTGGVMTSAMCALLLVQGHHLPWPTLMAWTFFMAVLGTVMAIPMKRQMINIEQLKFPSGIAAAETLKSLYGKGVEASQKARALFGAMGVGAFVAWLRDAHAAAGHPILRVLTFISVIPPVTAFPGRLRGMKMGNWTFAFEGSLIMVAAGMLMGLRTTISMLIGATINYLVVAPQALDHGAIKTHLDDHGATALGYRAIVSFSLWPGAALMVTSGLLTFALQWRTVLRAFSGIASLFRGAKPTATTDAEKVREEMDKIEVPVSWFGGGMVFATIGLVTIGYFFFGIRPWLGVLAVLLSFVLSIVACRATGETDTTPVGAMGKITQLTYGILAPANVVTNLMTASITAGAAGSSADLLTDLKSGYLLGANPRKQFLAQLSGTVVGTLVVVPAFYMLVPTPATLGTDRFPAPSAQVWKGVAEVLANGVESLHPWARWGMVVGGVVGLILPLLELAFPKHKKWIPSAMGIGLSLVIPWFNSFSMFLGAVIAYLWEKRNKAHAEKYVVAVASGIIAGESLLGVAVALMGAVGWLE